MVRALTCAVVNIITCVVDNNGMLSAQIAATSAVVNAITWALFMAPI